MAEATQDITNLIEQLEAFEDRLGVRLEGLFAKLNTYSPKPPASPKYFVEVTGELHPREGTKLERDIDVILTAYDSAGRVIGTAQKWFKSKLFFGFEVFKLTVQIPTTPVVKVRVYPKDA